MTENQGKQLDPKDAAAATKTEKLEKAVPAPAATLVVQPRKQVVMLDDEGGHGGSGDPYQDIKDTNAEPLPEPVQDAYREEPPEPADPDHETPDDIRADKADEKREPASPLAPPPPPPAPPAAPPHDVDDDDRGPKGKRLFDPDVDL